jgi:hypothetical protein
MSLKASLESDISGRRREYSSPEASEDTALVDFAQDFGDQVLRDGLVSFEDQLELHPQKRLIIGWRSNKACFAGLRQRLDIVPGRAERS